MFTQEQAIQAIKARIDGVFDDPELRKIGALAPSAFDDIKYIVDKTEATIED